MEELVTSAHGPHDHVLIRGQCTIQLKSSSPNFTNASMSVLDISIKFRHEGRKYTGCTQLTSHDQF